MSEKHFLTHVLKLNGLHTDFIFALKVAYSGKKLSSMELDSIDIKTLCLMLKDKIKLFPSKKGDILSLDLICDLIEGMYVIISMKLQNFRNRIFHIHTVRALSPAPETQESDIPKRSNKKLRVAEPEMFSLTPDVPDEIKFSPIPEDRLHEITLQEVDPLPTVLSPEDVYFGEEIETPSFAKNLRQIAEKRKQECLESEMEQKRKLFSDSDSDDEISEKIQKIILEDDENRKLPDSQKSDQNNNVVEEIEFSKLSPKTIDKAGQLVTECVDAIPGSSKVQKSMSENSQDIVKRTSRSPRTISGSSTTTDKALSQEFEVPELKEDYIKLKKMTIQRKKRNLKKIFMETLPFINMVHPNDNPWAKCQECVEYLIELEETLWDNIDLESSLLHTMFEDVSSILEECEEQRMPTQTVDIEMPEIQPPAVNVPEEINTPAISCIEHSPVMMSFDNNETTSMLHWKYTPPMQQINKEEEKFSFEITTEHLNMENLKIHLFKIFNITGDRIINLLELIIPQVTNRNIAAVTFKNLLILKCKQYIQIHPNENGIGINGISKGTRDINPMLDH